VCFRGVLLFGLLPRLGAPLAISLSVLPYGLVHLDKPLEEALGSIVVGIALAATAIWCRSIWYGLILHLIGAVALTLLARG
jgi:membrane protease YdiL (CAAX protease family)